MILSLLGPGAPHTWPTHLPTCSLPAPLCLDFGSHPHFCTCQVPFLPQNTFSAPSLPHWDSPFGALHPKPRGKPPPALTCGVTDAVHSCLLREAAGLGFRGAGTLCGSPLPQAEAQL